MKNGLLPTNLNEKTIEEDKSTDELNKVLLNPLKEFISSCIKIFKTEDVEMKEKGVLVIHILDTIIEEKVGNPAVNESIVDLLFLLEDDYKPIYKEFMVLLGTVCSGNGELANILLKQEIFSKLDYKEDKTYFLISNMCSYNSDVKNYFIKNIFNPETMKNRRINNLIHT